jgi:hypothetical protein
MSYKMFSENALRHFRKFADEVRITSVAPSVNAGAHDAVTPALRRAMARDERARYGSQNNGAGSSPRTGKSETRTNRTTSVATDVEAPDPDAVQAILQALRESLGDPAAAAVMKALHQKWPGCAGEMGGDQEEPREAFEDEEEQDRDVDLDNPEAEDEEDDDESSNWPGESRQHRRDAPGAQGWDNPERLDNEHQDTSNNPFRKAKTVRDNPLPFKGMPKTGGKMVGDSAGYASRWPEAARIRVDTWGQQPQPKRRKVSAAKMAQDGKLRARRDSSYARRWPSAAAIKVL